MQPDPESTPVLPPVPEFDARVVSDGSRPVVVVRGEIDLSTGPRFAEALDAAMAVGRSIELDLQGTTFMDSSAIMILLKAHARLGQRQDAIVLRDPSPAVLRVLDLAGVEQLFTIQTT